MGDVQVASGRWLRTPRLRNLPIQRYRESAIKIVYVLAQVAGTGYTNRSTAS